MCEKKLEDATYASLHDDFLPRGAAVGELADNTQGNSRHHRIYIMYPRFTFVVLRLKMDTIDCPVVKWAKAPLKKCERPPRKR